VRRAQIPRGAPGSPQDVARRRPRRRHVPRSRGPADGDPLGFLIAVVAGTLVAMALVVVPTTVVRRRPAAPAADEDGTAGTSVIERGTAGASA
jgi:hypothetical protein